MKLQMEYLHYPVQFGKVGYDSTRSLREFGLLQGTGTREQMFWLCGIVFVQRFCCTTRGLE